MRKVILSKVLILFLVFLVSCSVPEYVPQAEIAEEEPTEADFVDVEDNQLEEHSDVPVNKETSMFEFEGFAPGKSHTGTFEEMEGVIFIQDEKVVGMEGTIQASSVKSDSAGLDKHLKNDDFFDVEKYPTIEFSSMKIEAGVMTGTLNFHGVEKEVSFPVEVSGKTIKADFLLDTTPFNMKHAGVDKQVRIEFELKP